MALRKLQAEIDKTLKTVASGVEVFEATFDKLNHATNSTQKDKLETDLKTQIKKLQRMRDQIKAWLGSSDIKDKTALLDNRKLIETQMERFKALEKEMKMKAFSKEGLIAQSKLDPAEKARRDIIDWCGTMTDEMSRQIEATEAEAEALQGGKKKKAAGDRLGELEELNERRQWHIGRLEIVQRMLENGQLSVEQVESIQEDVGYFVDSNTEEDYEYDQGIYDDLNLQDEEELMPEFTPHDELSNLDSASALDISDAPKTPAKEDPPQKRPTPASKTTPASAPVPLAPEEPPSPILAKKQPSRKSTMDTTKVDPPPKPVPNKPAESTPAPAPIVAAPAPAPKPVVLPPIRYAAAAAAAVAPVPAAASATSAPAASIPTVPAPALAPAPSASTSAPVPAVPEVKREPTPLPEPEPAETSTPGAPSPPAPAPEPKEPPETNGHLPAPPPGLVTSPEALAPPPAPPQAFTSPAPAPNGVSSIPAGTQAPPGYANHAESSRAAAAFSSPRTQQGVLGNLMQSFDVAKGLSERNANDVNQLHAALDVSYANAPHQLDAEPPRYYHPRNPIKTPSYYPQARPPILESRELYRKFEIDQLFFTFYFHSGSYEQWLAAQQLKHHNWRFHKQYLTWFKRAHNPQAITEDYEQGGYFYFDWENSWCQRKKSDFRFEYRWLSDH